MISHDHEYTMKVAELAMSKIKALKLAADPLGFELWYTYATGRKPELNRRINEVIFNNSSLDELDEIANEFLSMARTQKVGTELTDEINRVVETLGGLTDAASAGRSGCAEASKRLKTSKDVDAIRAVALSLEQSLAAFEMRTAVLEQRLAASTEEITRLKDQLQAVSTEASLDSLTGLLTRRRFDAAFEEAVASTITRNSVMSLLMLDIDHFKKFNDRFGHLIGDSVLGLVGSTLRQLIKGHDVAARYGGEEFAIILPDTDAAGAVALAEQIRKTIWRRELKQRSSAESLGSISVSIGAAQLQADESAESLIERADSNLYSAKRTGRNCVWCNDYEPQRNQAAG
jgi:diguanylate cyclase